MYDQVTLGLNVDPFILSALKEDITSEDVSTNSVMPHPQAGEVDLICNRTESSVDCRFLREFSHCLMQIQR